MTNIKDMSHQEASTVLRMLEQAGSRATDKLLALAEHALATSPPEWAHVYRKRVEMYAAGRVVRWKTTTEDDVDPQLVADVNRIFNEEFGNMSKEN